MAFSPIFQRVFPATFDRRAAAAAAGNGLLNALVAYWPGNEASGDLLDAHTNALHLTDTNTVTSAAGKVYATARQYTAGNTEYHTRPGDDALLSAGDVDFTIAAWVYFDALGSPRAVAGKWGTAGAREYHIAYSVGVSAMYFAVSTNGTAEAYAIASTFGAISINTWYLVVAWHDATNNVIGIEVNGIPNTAAHATGVFDSTEPFKIGLHSVTYGNGRIGPTAFWKSAAGGGGVLSAAQRTALYNGGNGLAYAQFTT